MTKPETQPAATTEATPAAATTTQTQAPAVDDSLTLALAARAEYLSSGKSSQALKDAETTQDAPAEAQAESEAPEATPPANEPPAAAAEAEPAKEEPAPPAPPPKDAVADELAKIARAAQETARRKAELDAREKGIAAKAEAIAKAEQLQALAKTDPIKAVELLFGPGAATGDLAMQLVDAALKMQEGKPAPTPEEQQQELIRQAKEAAIKEWEAKQEAARKQAETDAQARREASKAHYFSQLDGFVKANADKYPLVAAEGFEIDAAEKFLEDHHKTTQRLATADEVLQHFEKKLEAKAAKLSGILAKRSIPAVPVPPATPPASSPRPSVDTRGKPPVVKKGSSFEEDRLARIAALNRT